MSDYPDPDEEYELMYADELELLREEEAHNEGNIVKPKSLPAKRSLDFSSPAPKQPLQPSITNTSTNNEQNKHYNDDVSLTPNLQPLDDVLTPNVSNKRTAEDLFGDIEDIDFDVIDLPSKRQKTEEEIDLELIDRIIESRKMRKILLEPSNKPKGNSKVSYDSKDNLSLNIPRWPFLPVTNSDGDRIYVRLESEESWDKSLNEIGEQQAALPDNYKRMWEEARKILEAKQQQIIEQSQEPLPDIEAALTTSNLWVDKYRPVTYLDLLSEEPVNRALLHWLHLWDKIVFKKEVKTKNPQQKNSFSKRTGQFELTNKWRGKRENEPDMDPDGRPHHKVALLCGPPGVGKTTLAHLLAKLAGYRPLELNASDERSTEAFRNALQSATLMKSVLDADRRPNCLILDEIDGAPLPTVELLVKWCTVTSAEGKRKGKAQAHPLKRPVIAICNDLYASALRPLRPVSLILHVGGASVSRLASRLALVAEREGVKVSPHVLVALATRAQSDVRAAIQVLSFIKAKKQAQLTIEDVENAAIGTKDCSKSIMQALQAIFTVNDKDPHAVLKTIYSAGEYDRLAEGIFENYLLSRVDARLNIACETLSWLRTFDLINSWTLRSQNYSLYGMLPLCLLRCHQILASRAPHRLSFPSVAQEVFRKKSELESTVISVWRGAAPAVSRPRLSLLLDVIPLLPYVLTPTLRSANVQLCSESERRTLSVCAGALCDYGLQYVQQRTQDGLYAFVLEPDIYKVAFFGNEERVRPPPAVRQALAREQQLEMIRRADLMAQRVSNQSSDPTKSNSEKDPPKPPAPSKEAKATVRENRLPNHLQRLKPKEVEKTAPQVHKDFFGRIVPLSQVQKSDAVPDVISSSNVFYQYREGFNNAVRRNVKTKDLL